MDVEQKSVAQLLLPEQVSSVDCFRGGGAACHTEIPSPQYLKTVLGGSRPPPQYLKTVPGESGPSPQYIKIASVQ